MGARASLEEEGPCGQQSTELKIFGGDPAGAKRARQSLVTGRKRVSRGLIP